MNFNNHLRFNFGSTRKHAPENLSVLRAFVVKKDTALYLKDRADLLVALLLIIAVFIR